MVKNYYSTREVANLVGLTPHLIKRLASEGKFPKPDAMLSTSTHHYFARSEVDEWLASRAT